MVFSWTVTYGDFCAHDDDNTTDDITPCACARVPTMMTMIQPVADPGFLEGGFSYTIVCEVCAKF